MWTFQMIWGIGIGEKLITLNSAARGTFCSGLPGLKMVTQHRYLWVPALLTNTVTVHLIPYRVKSYQISSISSTL